MSEMLHDLIQSALHFIEQLGVWGILLGLMLEVIPSEIVLAFGGYLVYRGEVSLIGAIVFGTIGCLFQQVILYWIGRYGGRPVVEKFGKYLHLKPKHLDIAEGWFNKYGPGMVFLARFVPVLRQAISIPAGMARMPMWQFLFYTTLGTIPWAILFVVLGRSLGDNWEQIEEVAGPFTKPLLIGVVVIVVLYLLWKLMKRRSTRKKDLRV
ncbi:DedA family protein [Paenibacillus sp. S-38]|uniref:DedA family protein n=1 Tax=Paenibacillus sp. S-38 TaxID=3416710 RepID=UPI003CF4B34C